MRILFLSNWYPYPPSNGSKLRIFNLLRGLAREHRVTLLTFADGPQGGTPPELAALCERVEAFRRPQYRPSSLRAVAGLLSSTPRVFSSTHDPEMAAAVQRSVAGGAYDLVVASEWSMSGYVALIPRVPAILEDPEVGLFTAAVEQASSPLHRLRHTVTLWKLRPYVRRLLRRFAACTVVSETEAALMRRFAPEYRPVVVIPNCVDVGSYGDVEEAPQPDTLIYSGALSYDANYDAVCWFVNDILPLVRSARPRVRLFVTGDTGGRSVPMTAGVELTGFVDDVRPLVASSWASLAPIRTGGGTRLKILESMALRTPVVSTSKGVEGIEAEPERHLLVADTATAFADAVVRLLSDPSLRQSIAASGHSLITARYDWAVALPSFLALAEQAATRVAVRGNA